MPYPTNMSAGTSLNMLQRDGTGHRKSCLLLGTWHGILSSLHLIHVTLGDIPQLVSGQAETH